jgi:hypothetical protein
VAAVEPLGDRTRVELAPPAAVVAELPTAAAARLAASPGSLVWATVDPAEISAQPA